MDIAWLESNGYDVLGKKHSKIFHIHTVEGAENNINTTDSTKNNINTTDDTENKSKETNNEVEDNLWKMHDKELESGDLCNDGDRNFIYKFTEEYSITPTRLVNRVLECILQSFTFKIKMPSALGPYDVYVANDYEYDKWYHIGESDKDGNFDIPKNIHELTEGRGYCENLCSFKILNFFENHELNRFKKYKFIFKNKKQVQIIRHMLEQSHNIYGLSYDAMTKDIKVNTYASRRNILCSGTGCALYHFSV